MKGFIKSPYARAYARKEVSRTGSNPTQPYTRRRSCIGALKLFGPCPVCSPGSQPEREALKRMKDVAGKLRAGDAGKWSQAKVATALGVAQQTVSDWFATNTGAGKGSQRPDSRVKVAPERKPEAREKLVTRV